MPRIGVRHGLPLLLVAGSLTFASPALAADEWVAQQQHGPTFVTNDQDTSVQSRQHVGPLVDMGAAGDSLAAWNVGSRSAGSTAIGFFVQIAERAPGGSW